MEDGQIVFYVVVNTRGAKNDIAGLTNDIKRETAQWEKDAKQSADGIEKLLSKALKNISTAAVAKKAGQALLDFGKQAIAAASDLEEVRNVVDVTFGTDASKIDTWAKNAGKQFGLTETQAKKFTSTLGAMMKSAGMEGSQITDMSTDLAGLAADMASFYNLDFDTAFQKIRSGISGETEPLKQLGINMSVANLEAFALAQGIEKAFNQMSQSGQTMLRYQYMMQATADAQGDFARTSDGYANACRMLETNIDNLKTKIGVGLLGAVNDVVAGINSMFDAFRVDESRQTALDDFAAIDLKTQDKIDQITAVANEARTLKGLLDDISNYGKTDDEGNPVKSDTASYFLALGSKSEEATAGLAALGMDTDTITKKQQQWLSVCKDLCKTIPGLSNIINLETGEVKGGTAAIEEYITAWEQGQKKLAFQQAVEEKRAALSKRFSDLPELELDMMVAKRRLKKNQETIDALREKYGFEGFNTSRKRKNGYGYESVFDNDEDRKAWDSAIQENMRLTTELDNAANAYNTQKAACEEAQAAIDEYADTIDELPDGMQDAEEAIEDIWADEYVTNAAKTAVSNAEAALKALADYVAEIRSGIESSIDSTLKGFEEILTPSQQAEKQIKDLTEEINGLDGTTKDGASQIAKLNEQINKLGGNKVTAASMSAGLDSQIKFIDDYLAALERAKSFGMSDQMLSMLSDGSAESLDYLTAYITGDDQQRASINAKYDWLNTRKQDFADTLTDNKLKFDETYDALKEKAKEAVEALDLGDAATEGMELTVSGIARGITNKLPEVKSAVDSIIAELERLGGYGIDLDYNFDPDAGEDGSHAAGLNYVPFNGYLARLHEGEGILTAEENRVWQQFKNGSPQIDAGTLGGVIADNVHAGGNVYLDGRTVGQVISARQGQAFRNLQRSGWQG